MKPGARMVLLVAVALEITVRHGMPAGGSFTASDMMSGVILPIGGLIVAYLVSLYFLMVDMRLLGVLYEANQEALGWFN